MLIKSGGKNMKMRFFPKSGVLTAVACFLCMFKVNAELVLHWSFDDGAGSGTAADSTTNNHTGVLTNMDPATDWIASGLPPVPGGTTAALDFDGGNDTVNASVDGYQGVTGKEPRTAAAWIKTSALSTITSWGSNVAGQKFTFRVQDSNGTDGAVRVEVNGGFQVGARAVNDGQWHHVAAVLPPNASPNVTDIRLYVDGEIQGSSASQGQAINTAAGVALRVGQDFTNPWFKGQMDDFRLYDHALTGADIAALAGTPDAYLDAVIADAPEVYWRLGENAGSRAVNEGTSWSRTDASYLNIAQADRYLSGLIAGSGSRAVSFDGDDDRITIPNDDDINTGSSYPLKTMESWFKTNAYATNETRRVIFEQGGASNGFCQYLQLWDDDYHFRAGVWLTSSGVKQLFPTRVLIETGRVYHAVSVYNASAGLFVNYLNGACVSAGSSASMLPVPTHTGDVRIGGTGGDVRMDNNYTSVSTTNNAFDGIIDEVATYNKDLSHERIQEHYIAGSGDSLGLRDGVTRGVLLNYDADNDTDGNTSFEDSIGSLDNAALPDQFDWLLSGVSRVQVSDRLAAVTNAYRFDASGTASMRSIQYVAGFSYVRNSTIEVVFDPADFNGNEAIFETGGSTTGTSLALNGSTLRLYTRYNGSVNADLQFDLNELSAWQQNGFIHAVGAIDLVNTNIALYVNGELKGKATANGALVEWSGNNDAGLGSVSGTVASPVTLAKFDGDIALMRLYSELLDADQILANYLALEPPPDLPGTIILIQ